MDTYEDASCLLSVGCQINNWVLDTFLAKGGFGNVFKGVVSVSSSKLIFLAHDVDSKEVVIIKVGNSPGKNYLQIETEIYEKLSGKGIDR
jgi:hypothetical protein